MTSAFEVYNLAKKKKEIENVTCKELVLQLTWKNIRITSHKWFGSFYQALFWVIKCGITQRMARVTSQRN